VLERLLTVQGHDTAIDQLRHRLEAHPARAELARIADELAALERAAADVRERRDAVVRRQRVAEDDLASLETKIAELDARLYGGTITAPKELQALQADIESLRRHASEVEDRVLATFEELEPMESELATADARRDGLDAEAMRRRAELAEAEADDGLPADLLARYDDLRNKLGGVGAARLEAGGRCSGCHLTLPATEVARIKREPPDTVFACDQCGRILVRTE
jgi:predicted  nucleic acid-binding Zn-ribbon protein